MNESPLTPRALPSGFLRRPVRRPLPTPGGKYPGTLFHSDDDLSIDYVIQDPRPLSEPLVHAVIHKDGRIVLEEPHLLSPRVPPSGAPVLKLSRRGARKHRRKLRRHIRRALDAVTAGH